jgi:hypothetical protein
MAIEKETLNCGKAVRIGVGIVPAIKEGDEEINGALFAEGPVVFGLSLIILVLR